TTGSRRTATCGRPGSTTSSVTSTPCPTSSNRKEYAMYGTLETLRDGSSQLCFTRTLAHPPEKVWKAITEPQDLARWFPTTIEGERAAGAPLRFSFPGGQAPPFEGEMIAYEPPTLMEFRWGPDVLRLELRPTEDGTELTLLDT